MAEENNIPQEPTSDAEDQKLDEDVMNHLIGKSDSQQKIKSHLPNVLIAILIFIFAVVGVAMGLAAIGTVTERIMGSWGIGELGHSLQDYFEKNNSKLPEMNKWCDVMLESEGSQGSGYYVMFQYEDHKDDFPYTLNKNAFECKDAIPDDMVLVFEGEGGWNKVGGYESVRDHHQVRILFGNGEQKIARARDLPYLRWKIDDDGVVPKPDLKVPLTVLSSILGVVFLGLIITHQQCLKLFWIFALGMGVLSAFIGIVLGAAAEESFYTLEEANAKMALMAGSVWGFIVGVCFVLIIGRIYKKYNGQESMAGVAIVIGALTGAIASSIVHGYLMISYGETSFRYMILASGFGIIAGMILGWISSGIIRFYKNNPAVLEGKA